MKRLPIKQGYAGHGVTLYYSGEYMIVNNKYYLFFIADNKGIIYDTLLLDIASVIITESQIKTIQGEVFNRI